MRLTRHPDRITVLLLLLLLSAVAVTVAANETEAAPPEAPLKARLTGTDVFDVTSQAGNVYRISVAKPETQPPPEGFPVLYVLDANAYFDQAVETHRRTQLPSLVIVGVGYPTNERFDRTRRTYDLTMPADAEKLPPTRIRGGWPKSGGADAFLEFLESELKPRIAKSISIDDERQAIFGHSFGGLFVMHTLFTRPETFQRYIAVSPSGWWNDYALLDTEQRFAARVESLDAPARLLIAVGQDELRGDVGPAAALDPTPASRAFGTTRDFAQRLMRLENDRLRVTYREFAGKGHGTVVPPALEEAVRFATPVRSPLKGEG